VQEFVDFLGGQALDALDAGGRIGIVTDVDFRQKVATGRATQAQGLLRMVERGVHHLLVVDQAGRPSGVLRAVDLAGAESATRC
jgi:CBS domain-containing protein